MSNQINDGGPAFPVPPDQVTFTGHPEDGPGYSYSNPGMSLRDWFAGQSLSAILLASLQGHTCRTSNSNVPLGPEDYAKAAYENADAMIAAREKS